MIRVALALLAIVAVVALALARPGADGPLPHAPANAQTTGAAPAFPDTALTYTLNAGANGSSTAITLGTIPFTAGTFTGGTDACAEASEFLAPDINTFVSSGGTTSAVLSVSSACVITYTGAATASAIDSTRQGWSLTVNIVDGRTETGGAPSTGNGGVDDTIAITIQLTDASTDLAALNALYANAGGSSWTTQWPGASSTPPFKEQLYHTYMMTVGVLQGIYGFSASPSFGSISNRDVTRNSRTWTIYLLRQATDNQISFWMSQAPSAAGWTDFEGLSLRRGGIQVAISGRTGSSGRMGWHIRAPRDFLIGQSGSIQIALIGPPVQGTTPTDVPASARAGVTVNSDGRVTGIELGGFGLSGAASTALSSLASLTNLTTLDLSGNTGLTGAIPIHALRSLRNLETLDLSGIGLTGDIPTQLGELTTLTDLDLSDNALTGELSDVPFGSLRSLETLDLSGNAGLSISSNGFARDVVLSMSSLASLDITDTDFCISRKSARYLGADGRASTGFAFAVDAMSSVVSNVTSRNSNMGVVKVDPCADTVFTAPSFPADTAAIGLTSAADGSTTAITLGDVRYMEVPTDRFPGRTFTCAIASAIDNPSDDPADHLTTGTARTGFTVGSSYNTPTGVCRIHYTGTGITRAAGTLEAVSLAVTIRDGYDPEEGTRSTDADDTILVTVKLGTQATDRAALNALYAASSGGAWTTDDNWVAPGVIHVFGITAATQGTSVGFDTAPSAGSVRSGRTITRNGRTYTLNEMLRLNVRSGQMRVQFNQRSQKNTDFGGLRLRIGTHTANFPTAVAIASSTRFEIEPWPALTSGTDYDAEVIDPNSPGLFHLWHGVTLTNGRVTGLALSDNNLDPATRRTVHTIGATAAESGSKRGYNSGTSARGSLQSGGTITRNGRTYTLSHIRQDVSSGSNRGEVEFAVTATDISMADADFRGLSLKIGGTEVAFPFSGSTVSGSRFFFFSGFTVGMAIPQSGAFTAELTEAVPSPSAATALAPLANLPHLTALDLSDNTDLAGPLPVDILTQLTSLTSLDLSGVGFTGSIAPLAKLTNLATLDLSDNSGLTADPAAMRALALGIPAVAGGGSLNMLDLSGTGTGVCADASDDVVSRWIWNIRRSGFGMGIAKVDTCGTPMGPAFPAAVSLGMTAGFDASLPANNVTVGSVRFTPSTYAGVGAYVALGQHACNLVAARTNASNDPADWNATDATETDVSSVFQATVRPGNVCEISYFGDGSNTGITPGTREAISLQIGVSDVLNPTTGAYVTTGVDATVQVTVVLRGITTDRDALWAVYDAAGGASWSAQTGWGGADIHTFQLTSTVGQGARGYIHSASAASAILSRMNGQTRGSVRSSSGAVTVGGVVHNLRALYQQSWGNELPLVFVDDKPALTAAKWANISLRFGTTVLDFADATSDVVTGVGRRWTWSDPGSSTLIPTSGNYDVVVAGPRATPSATNAYSGVTLSGTPARVTGMAVSDFGLTGAAGTVLARLADLDALTSLDLSENTGLTGALPLSLFKGMSGLTTLDLSDIGFSGSIPAAVGDLPASLTTLDLGGNGLSGSIPDEIGSLTGLTVLSLANNSLTGDLPDELGDLTALTTLNLADNAGLTATVAVLDVLAGKLSALTNLDLSNTAICVSANAAEQADIRAWLQDIREKNSNTGVARVRTCGAPTSPVFTAAATDTVEVDSGASGGTTPIAIGEYAVSWTEAGKHWGVDAPSCALAARTNGSNDPARFATSGGTVVTTDFTATLTANTFGGATSYSCDVTYTGAGLTAADTTLEAVSIYLVVRDGVDQAAGTISNAEDDVVRVTVKLVNGQPTDRDALDALYRATGGDSWTTWNWMTQHHNYNARAGTASTQQATSKGQNFRGYQRTGESSGLVGGAPGGSPLRLGSAGHSLRYFYRHTDGTNAGRVEFRTSQGLPTCHMWSLGCRGWQLLLGDDRPPTSASTAVYLLELDRATGANTNLFWWNNQPADIIPADGQPLNVRLVSFPAVSSSWNGVTVDATSTRVTAVDFSDNNLVGPLPNALGDLTALTTLDLSDNSITGAIPATFGDMTALTSLDLSDNSLGQAIPDALGDLTALTMLDLSSNSLTGLIPDGLKGATALTSIDLSGNSGLIANTARLEAWAGALTSVSNLDFGSTGICADASSTAIDAWITAIREMTSGVAIIETCGTANAAAAFTEPAETFSLGGSADGSTTAIEVGAPAFTESTFVGAKDAECTITSARTNASGDPADWASTGGTDVSSDFTLSGCTISYGGDGTNIGVTLGSLEAVSIGLSISDGLDPDAGAFDSSFTADDTIQVTVKLSGLTTDRDNLNAFYDATGGASWTTDWKQHVHHTWTVTVASSGSNRGYSGVTGSTFGSITNNTLTLNGRSYTVRELYRTTGCLATLSFTQDHAEVTTDFEGLRVQLGSLVEAAIDPEVSGSNAYLWRGDDLLGDPCTDIPNSGMVEVKLVGPPVSGMTPEFIPVVSRNGVSVGGTPARVQGLDLEENNLVGAVPTALGQLDSLTQLDLNENPGLVGDGAVPVTVLRNLRLLTNLSLHSIGYTSMADGLGGRLTALQVLALNDNALAALPSDFGQLTALRTVDLQNNRLTALPSNFGDLTTLRTLNLSGNAITALPTTFGDLAALEDLDLSDNSFSGDSTGGFGTLATELSTLTALTNLDLSGNSGLTGSIPADLRSLTSLIELDLSGTSVCVDPSTETATETWLTAIRARAGGIAKVTTCGDPRGPYIVGSASDPAYTWGRGAIDAGVDGSGTGNALSIASSYRLVQGTYSGGGTATCTLATAKQSASLDIASFADGATDTNAAGFTIDSSTCAVTYTGTGLTSSSTFVAVHIKLTVSDGVDPTTGRRSTAADHEHRIIVRVVGLATDRLALVDLYQGTGGASWTTSTNWDVTQGSTLDSTWHGVTVTSNRVSALDLSSNGLTGVGLPDSFADLSSIRTIDLSGNPGLTGPLSINDWATWLSLNSIDLSDSGWSGEITGTNLGFIFTTLHTLDLSGNALSGDIPATALAQAGTSMRTLDLSDNAALGGSISALTALTGLTMLDLSGTRACVSATSADDAAVRTWISNLRATSGTVAKVETCGGGVDPAFTESAETFGLTAGADGSGTGNAITVGTPAFTASTHAALPGLTACGITSARTNASIDPADWSATGGTSVSADFVLDANCAILYTGTGIDAVEGTTEAVSIGMSIRDGLDPDAGTEDTAVDDTIQITVRLRGLLSDRDALNALYDAAGGSSWTTDWRQHVHHTWTVTVGSSGSNRGYSGVTGSTFGSIADNDLELNGRSYTVRELYRTTGCLATLSFTQDHAEVATDFDGLRVQTGNIVEAALDPEVHMSNAYLWRGDDMVADPCASDDAIPNSGSVEVKLVGPPVSGMTPEYIPLASRQGVSIGGTPARVQGLDLDENGLVGTVPAELAELDGLTVLDLSSNPGLAGDGAVPVTALRELRLLQEIGLNEIGYTSMAAGLGDRLTALRILDLRDNRLAALPSDIGDLSALTYLQLDRNRLSALPANFGDLTALRRLYLRNNALTSVPAGFGGLTALLELFLDGNRLTDFDALAAELTTLTSLTRLDLSGNRTLTGSIPAAMHTLTALTSLDLGDTGVCVNPATETATEAWLNALRMAGAFVTVNTCGSPNAPTLADAVIVAGMDAGADGSTTPIAAATPTFRAGTYSGGTDVCTIVTAIANPSADPSDFLTTGTDLSGQFAIDGSTCAVTYTGSGLTRTPTQQAVSIAIQVTDGVNATGGVDSSVDDTARITVKLFDLQSDRAALVALYDATNGDGWTANTSWGSMTLSGSWTGVTITGGRVTGLSLTNNNLSGRLPALLGDLNRLVTLDLSENSGLGGGIPWELTALGAITTFDVRATRICARNIGIPAVNAWLAGIAAKPSGAVRLGECPVAPAPTASATGITVVEEGDAAPTGARYGLELTCGGSRVSISLAAGERYAATVPPGAVCSLTVTDRVDATAVRGEFAGQTLGGSDVTVTFVLGTPAEGAGAEPGEPDPVLERTLVEGIAYARWAAPDMPVGLAVRPLTLCVIAVYWWDAPNQAWRSWFPGGEALGVNTLETLERGGIYVFSTEERTRDNCGLLAEDAATATG